MCWLHIANDLNFPSLGLEPYALADPGGGAHPARAPPNGRGPMIFNAQNAIFSHSFSSLASLAIHLKHNFKRNMAKTRKK